MGIGSTQKLNWVYIQVINYQVSKAQAIPHKVYQSQYHNMPNISKHVIQYNISQHNQLYGPQEKIMPLQINVPILITNYLLVKE